MKKILIFMLTLTLLLCACGSETPAATTAAPETTVPAENSGHPEFSGLEFENETPLLYAECFRIFNYQGGFSCISVVDGDTYLVIPEGREVPAGIDAEIVVLQQPLEHIYMAASSAMSLFQAVDALENVRFSATQQNSWYIPGAVEAMEKGDILFAGKYSEPDYELLISENCDLAIESTMIYHSPKVKEMLEDLDIPVFVDRASYEPHPLGRTEWIKLYAVFTGKQAEAEAFFNEQAAVIEQLKDFPDSEKTMVYFHINSDGNPVIRAAGDYIPKMMQLAGAKYAFADLETTESGTSFAITMETFYAMAVDADYLIYNGDIETGLSSIDDLIAKDALFADFKAVKEGNVWRTGKSFYQSTHIVGRMIKDMNLLLTDGDESEMTFLSKVN